MLSVKPELVQPNMVFVKAELETAQQLAQFLESKGIRVIAGETMRWVMHLDVTSEQLDYVCQQVEAYFSSL